MRTKDVVIIVVTFILALILTYCDSSNKRKQKAETLKQDIVGAFQPHSE